MKVAIDVSILSAPEPTGVERVLETIIDGVLATPVDLELVLCSPAEDPCPRRLTWKNDSRVTIPPPVTGALANAPLWFWRESVLPRFLGQVGAEVVHSPVVAIPLRAPCPKIATVHELPWLHEKVETESSAPHRLATQLAVTFASRIICVSEGTRADLLKQFPDVGGKVDVISNALAPHFSAESSTAWPSSLRGDERPFVLAVGRLRSKKNLECLADVLEEPRFHLWRLVLVGPDGDAADALRQRASGRLVVTGYVSDGELSCLYRHASALVMPSHLEGFGLPVLESMALGTPVVASRQGPVKELAEGVAEIFDAGDPACLSEVLYAVLTDEKLRADCVERGLERAAEFDVSRAVEAIVDLWAKVGVEREGAVESPR
ncbi:MAG: glycosyltransferase family 1 protein [Planctomycetota bacterium]|nr:glycosyltransferase family 1 protein [Planctomycetota bacterium]